MAPRVICRDPAAAGMIASLAAALGLRLYQFGFFEFKGEQAGNIMHGMLAREHFFLLNHGLETSVGIPNTALFYQWCGILSFFSTSPVFFAGISLLAGCAGTFLLYFVLCRKLGRTAAAVAVMIAFCTPFMIFLSANIWPPVYLVPVVPVLLWGTGRGDARGWMIAALTAVLAGMVHFSGFFLGPGLLWIAWRRRIGWRPVLLTGSLALLMLSPWLYHLAFEWNRQWFPAPDGPSARPLSLLWETFGMFGPGFLKEYFSWDFMAPAGRYTGPAAAWLFAGMSALPVWSGVFSAVRHWSRMPETVRNAVILAGSVLAGYGILLIHVYFFYMFLPAALLAVAAGYGFMQMKKEMRCGLLTVWVIGSLGLTGSTQLAIDCSGGHPQEYGPSYRFWQEVRQELDELSGGKKIALQIRASDRAKGKLDPPAIWFMLKDRISPAGLPVTLMLDFDEAGPGYIRQYRRISSDPQRTGDCGNAHHNPARTRR